VAVLRDGRLVLPTPDTALETGDEVLALATDPDTEAQLGQLLSGEQDGPSPV
jgi:Trk K+ transport system NAD-binding subunit